jgi:methylenetetrahydrofolate dehydrogenase (NADP+) / methenyltetrahydrofolate cyclohydrolase
VLEDIASRLARVTEWIMPAQTIDGALVSGRVRERVAAAVRGLPGRPCLAVVLVGDDPASQVYVKSKGEKTEAAGMRSITRRLPADSSQAVVEQEIATLNADPDVDGILLQLPLPKGLDEAAAIARIDPDKDVDGLTEVSAGRLVLGKAGLRPCTPTGCVILARHALGDDLGGRHVVVIGRSILVGKPTALLFLAENCTVTIAHSRTRDLAAVCRTADILVPAVGRPEMVRGDWVKPGAVVIDVGINRIPAPEKGAGKTRLVGDAHFAEVSAVAGHVSPVPGGVGLMTVACLLRNTVLAACARRGWAIPRELEA